jgi:acetyl-CoA carboxylase biotin carboxylase subunit
MRRILVANRGEIALRVVRACRELGIESVVVYSDADRRSLAVSEADRALRIGGSKAADSYLNAAAIIGAALSCKADAIHPGYGFLSENADFAELCRTRGLVWIGPEPEAIRLMGDKAAARSAAAAANVPTTPGSQGVTPDGEDAARIAAALGYPVLLKASAGGGGRGMRVVSSESALRPAFAEARAEADAAFGDGSLYVEKFLPRVRHVEVQILADGRDVLHVGERDCSSQRRNQKLVEESPANIPAELRKRMTEAAVRLARSVGYTNAGTIEFIVDAEGNFYFMEMNTRIQVEHPVTEMVTGIDLVKSQIRIAAGEALGFAQGDIVSNGHAIECRINAEDPERGFAPCPGVVTDFLAPGGPGVRVDSHLYPGYTVPPFYDSLVAKLVAWGNDRAEAIRRMTRALGEMRIDGVRTTIPFHRRLLEDPEFLAGRVHTRYVENEFLARRPVEA